MSERRIKKQESAGRTVLAVIISVLTTMALFLGAVALMFHNGILRAGSDTMPGDQSPVLQEDEQDAEIPTDAEPVEQPAETIEETSAEEPQQEADNSAETEEEPVIDEALQAEIAGKIAEADFIAAGYDYEKASELLCTIPNYDLIPEVAEKLASYAEEESKLVVYQNMSGISHVFFHSLIVDTDRAFDGDSKQDGYNLYMTTCDEFRDILEDLYERGYVLVTPYQVAGEVDNGDGSTKFAYREILLPEGKTPIMMSQDDVNYYGYMIGNADGSCEIPVFANTQGDGFASRIVIGEDGYPTCEYMDAEGNLLYGEYDLVPILEDFIQEHPDFSYRGARAVLGVTAYEGILGYRTKPSYEEALGTEAYQKEIEDAKAVVQCLREHGWIIASHTYGHPALGSVSVEKVASDTEKFYNTTYEIIGQPDILIYPYGSDIAGVEKYTMSNEKFAILYEQGYRYFFNVDNCVAWHQMGDDYFRGNRRDLDGFRMYHYPDSMNDIIDSREVLDEARPLPVPNIS